MHHELSLDSREACRFLSAAYLGSSYRGIDCTKGPLMTAPMVKTNLGFDKPEYSELSAKDTSDDGIKCATSSRNLDPSRSPEQSRISRKCQSSICAEPVSAHFKSMIGIEPSFGESSLSSQRYCRPSSRKIGEAKSFVVHRWTSRWIIWPLGIAFDQFSEHRAVGSIVWRIVEP